MKNVAVSLPEFSSVRSQIFNFLVKIYSTPQNYNTDIIVEKDGNVRCHDYFGNVDYRDSNIIFVYTVHNYDTNDYLNMMRENLSEAQRDFCEEKGWLTIYQTKSENQDDWEQFESSDDDFFDTLEQIEGRYNEAILEYKLRNEL